MYNSSITINNVKIGEKESPYVIAELSANHNGSIENAFKIISHAKECGASAVKIQTYTPDTITLNLNTPDFQVDSGIWKGKSLYELYEGAHLPWEWHKPLFEFAKEVGITIFSSPFDKSAVDLLESLNTPAYKIASCEIIDLPLIKYVANTQKPIIISTGMASLEEINAAIETCFSEGNQDIALLHCVSGYPTPDEDYNLNAINTLKKKFQLVTGLSDHTISNNVALTSLGLGASIFEKHVTLSKNGGGPDDSFSLEPHELKNLCSNLQTCWLALGNGNKEIRESEVQSLKFRRSLYFVKDMMPGDIITEECIKSIRPGYGMHPKEFDNILGKKVSQEISYGSPVKAEYFEL